MAYSTDNGVDMEINEMSQSLTEDNWRTEAGKGDLAPASAVTSTSTAEMKQMAIECAFQQKVNKLVSDCSEALNQQQSRTGGTSMQGQVKVNERRCATNQRGYQYRQNRMGHRFAPVRGPCHICSGPH